MTTWEEIRDEVAGMLADGQPLEDVIGKLDEMNKPKPMTNEEYLKSLDTEQLAEFLIVSIKNCKSCASGIDVDEVQHCPFGECGCHFKDEVIKWLKQPHTNE